MIYGPRDTLKRARKLRSEMSLPETMLWRELRKRPGGHKFRRQHPAGVFVLDFYCAKARLDLEVDGWVHNRPARAEQDRNRSNFLSSQGIATTRVPAQRVLEDLEAVVRRIVVICDERIEKLMVPLHHAPHGPPPRSGEDS
ncbi:endonuclease domain-containing protein [uncultured Erythrobacter sp.]|uniref:endonuclease domain-containing protein n=1 Tax=uncultured Erythrobacter sp. TaxID=263913 RepID=UPI00265AB31A|nr:endonuclease domain-containing protein [uncultured Erythrobacter sp.]